MKLSSGQGGVRGKCVWNTPQIYTLCHIMEKDKEVKVASTKTNTTYRPGKKPLDNFCLIFLLFFTSSRRLFVE